jgi:hypothetical protein
MIKAMFSAAAGRTSVDAETLATAVCRLAWVISVDANAKPAADPGASLPAGVGAADGVSVDVDTAVTESATSRPWARTVDVGRADPLLLEVAFAPPRAECPDADEALGPADGPALACADEPDEGLSAQATPVP